MTYPTIRPEITLDFANSRQLDPRITFSRSSGATYLNPDTGLITLASDHEARFEKEGLLIEESRTNYMNYSIFSFNTQQGTNIVKENNTPDIAAPDGTFTATHITADSINYLNSQFPSPASTDVGKQFTYSYWVYVVSCTPRSGSGTDTDNTIRLGIDTNSVLSYVNRTVEKNKWVRIQVTTSNTYVSGKNVQCSMFRDNKDVDLYVWGFQCENGSSSTSLIPTSGSASTRALDIARITGNNFSSWYNQTEGTMFVSMSDGVRSDLGANLYGSHSADRIVMLASSNSRFRYQATGQATSSWTNANIYSANDVRTAGPMKYAYAYKPDDYALSVKGSTLTTERDPQPNVITLKLGEESAFGGNGRPNAAISRIAYYPRRLTNAELEAITL